MATKKSELETTVELLRARLAKAEAKAERWKARAKRAEAQLDSNTTTGATPPPEQAIAQTLAATFEVVTTAVDDAVTSARAAFDDLMASTRGDSHESPR